MKVYKYRSNLYFNRDLKSLIDNNFFAPTYNNLNDPCETIVLTNGVDEQLRFLDKILIKKGKSQINEVNEALTSFVSRKNDVGIYSLSKSYNDELLWAHYASNHEGFCIEYDLETLTGDLSFHKHYCFEVDYSSQPPAIDFNDFSFTSDNLLLRKVAGTKSRKWSYEEEIRIITDKSGLHHYFYNSLRAIYFGLRMEESNKIKMMKALSGRRIQFYQIKHLDNTYIFHREEINNPFDAQASEYIGSYNVSNRSKIYYNINSVEYQKPFNKGVLKIFLVNRINEREIEGIGKDLKNKLFKEAERVFIFFYLEDDLTKSRAWATCHFDGNRVEVGILGINKIKRLKFEEIIKTDQRDVLGHWIDESNLNALITIYKDGQDFIMETFFSENSILIEKLLVSKSELGLKYQGVNDFHGEYVVVNENSELEFYSESGLFNKIRAYSTKKNIE